MDTMTRQERREVWDRLLTYSKNKSGGYRYAYLVGYLKHKMTDEQLHEINNHLKGEGH
jgi:hypothetical protein